MVCCLLSNKHLHLYGQCLILYTVTVHQSFAFYIFHFSFHIIVTVLLNVYGDVLYHKALYIVYKFTWFYPFGKDHGSEVVCHAPLYQVLCHHTGQHGKRYILSLHLTLAFVFSPASCI